MAARCGKHGFLPYCLKNQRSTSCGSKESVHAKQSRDEWAQHLIAAESAPDDFSHVLFHMWIRSLNAGIKHASVLFAEIRGILAANCIPTSINCVVFIRCSVSRIPWQNAERLLQGCAARPRYFKQPRLSQCHNFWNPNSMISWPRA